MLTWVLIQNQILLLLLLYYINIIYFTEFKYSESRLHRHGYVSSKNVDIGGLSI